MLMEHQLDFGRGPARYVEAGEARQTLHFASANGLPVAAYQSFLVPLTDNFRVIGLENRGVWSPTPPAPQFNWQQHAEDLLQFLDYRRRQGMDSAPVIAIGHSIGGTVSALAAARRPDLFKALIMIDPATVPSRYLNWLPASLLRFIMGKTKLVTGTRRRRQQWPSSQDFIDSMRTKAAYRHFSPQALQEYAEGGLLARGRDGVKLRYSPAWEAHNFKNTSTPWRALKIMTVPTLVLRAQHSYLHPAADFAYFSRRFSAQVSHQVIPDAGHMAIQENLAQTLSLCRDWLRQQGLLADNASTHPTASSAQG